MRGRSFIWMAGFTLLLPAQQAIPPDELQLRQEAYWPPSTKPLTAEARSVEVGVVVRDSHGHAVAGLIKDDFEIEEGGKRQEITDFSVEVRAPQSSASAPSPAVAAAIAAPTSSGSSSSPAEARPRFLAMVFDDFSMETADLIPARTAAGRFFSEGLGKQDRASVFFLSRGQIVPFTADTEQLKESMAGLKPVVELAYSRDCPKISSYEAYSIVEQHSAAILGAKVAEAMACGLCAPRDPTCPEKVSGMARNVWEESLDRSRRALLFLGNLADGMAKLPGQRVIVLTSSGFFAQTLGREQEDLVDKALRNGVVINALDAKGLYTEDLRLGGNRVTQPGLAVRQNMGTRPEAASNDAPSFLADSTGGTFFHNNNDIQAGFHELGLAPDVSYYLAFTPPGTPDNYYHKLNVRLPGRKNVSIQARPGYYDLKVATPPPKPERPIDREILASDTPTGVPATVSASPVTADGGPALRVVLHLGVGELPFVNQDGVRRLEVNFIAALFDDHATFVTGQLGQAIFALKDYSFQRMRGGLNSGLNLSAPPGKYRLRCVVWESNGGKFTATNQTVEIN